MTQPTIYFFEDKPLFGLDIGHGTVRVLQLQPTKGSPRVIGYGETSFDSTAITDGVIEKPEIVAKAIQELFEKHLIGDITTNRVAIGLPIARAFTRSFAGPNLDKKELAEAVQTEAEEYIPAPTDDLYIDYTCVSNGADRTTVFMVAMPKRIVESYLMLGRLLGLEVVVLQTSSGACAQLFTRDTQHDVPTVLVDFDSESADITVYDNGPVVSGTVACGGEQLTQALMHELHVTTKEADTIKFRYGLSHNKKQKQIEAALQPVLELLIKEIKRTIRYYEEHVDSKQTIAQIVIMGGGANMPGMAEYLTNQLRLAVRPFDPTAYISFGKLQPFHQDSRMSYVATVGLAAIEPTEVFV